MGLLLSIAALVLLITSASIYGTIWHIVSFSIFGSSLIILYAASTFYHLTKAPAARKTWKIIDHAAIYVLIAGTYTPFTLVTLHGVTGWVLFGITWGMAAIGIVLKLFFTGRFKLISTIIYIFMGWLIIFFIRPLMNNLPLNGLIWLIAGGVSYTIGAVFYSIKKIKYNHAIFHLWVLLGSICQFISVLFYVL